MKESSNIALIGFAGTGKTTIGRRLAQKMSFEFVDTDKMTADEECMSVKDIFNTYGEAYFREKETLLLKKLVNRDNQIISTGGGLVLREENRKLLLDNCFVVSLRAKPDNIYFRIKDNKERPLLNTAHPQKTIRQLLHHRDKYYRECDFAVNTDELNISNAIDMIMEEYYKYNG